MKNTKERLTLTQEALSVLNQKQSPTTPKNGMSLIQYCPCSLALQLKAEKQ